MVQLTLTRAIPRNSNTQALFIEVNQIQAAEEQAGIVVMVHPWQMVAVDSSVMTETQVLIRVK